MEEAGGRHMGVRCRWQGCVSGSSGPLGGADTGGHHASCHRPPSFLVQPERTAQTGPRQRASKGPQRAGVGPCVPGDGWGQKCIGRPGPCACVCECAYTGKRPAWGFFHWHAFNRSENNWKGLRDF